MVYRTSPRLLEMGKRIYSERANQQSENLLYSAYMEKVRYLTACLIAPPTRIDKDNPRLVAAENAFRELSEAISSSSEIERAVRNLANARIDFVKFFGIGAFCL